MGKNSKETQAKADAKRSKTWCVIAYPDDLPPDWLARLEGTGVQFVISPEHDRDLNADGQPKKRHNHLMPLFTSKKSAEQVRDMFAQLFGVTESGSICGIATISDQCIVHDRRAMVRYLCHLDNPEKAQYDTADIVAINGADVNALLLRSLHETQSVLREIMAFIDYNDITELYDLARYAQDNAEWFLVITTKCTLFLSHYIKSRRFKRASEQGAPRIVKPIIDPETGEVLNEDELKQAAIEDGGADNA